MKKTIWHGMTAVAGLAILIPVLLAAGGGSAEDRREVEQIIRDCTGWALTKDFNRLESILTHDDLFFFSQDSRGTVTNWSEFTKLYEFWKDPRFKAIRYELRDLRITFSRGGEAAWYSVTLDDIMEWDGKPLILKDTRWTGVLEKRDGKWVIVQMHYSFAADKVRAEERQKLESAAGAKTK